MGGCCGGAADVDDDAPLDVPRRGRDASQAAEHTTREEAAADKATWRSSKASKKRRESFTALGTIDTHARRASCGSSDSASRTNGATPTRTTTAATSHPGCTPATSVGVAGEATQSVFDALPNNRSVLRAASAAGTATREGAEAVLSDVFHISASSSSSSLADCDALSTSLVEVSQATQSFRHHERTVSEMDVTSEWAEASMDRTYKRRSQSRLTDRNRLQYLLSSEAEVRTSLTHMYAQQHCRMLLRCVKEQLIEQRVAMLREAQEERTALCVAWLLARERAARGGIAREWWTERAALARRSNVPTSDAIDVMKRDDSAMHNTSNTGHPEELSSSEVTAEEESASLRSPSIRLCTAAAQSTTNAASPSPPPPAPSLTTATRAAQSSSTAASPSPTAASPGGRRALSAAQQALRDRVTRGRRPSGEAVEGA